MSEILRLREGDGSRVAVVVGVAGAGKTSQAMDLVAAAARSGIDPRRIGFLSFSRAAVAEAARRAAEIVGSRVEDLTQGGYYRTIHSAAVRLLGIDVKSILDVAAPASQEWWQDQVGLPYGGERGTLGHRVATVIDCWDRARQRLSPVAWTAADPVGSPDGRTPVTEVSGSSVRSGTNENTGFEEASGRSGHYAFSSVRSIALAKTLGPDAVSDDFPYTYMSETKKIIRSHSEQKVVSEVSGENKSIYSKDLLRTPWCPRGVRSVRKDGGFGQDVTDEWIGEVIDRYERGKNLSSRIDFCDILLRFCHLEYSAQNYQLTDTLAIDRPDHIELWLCDEYQDCSALLDLTAQHLWGPWAPVTLLGDPRQAVYRFSGSDPEIMQAWQDDAEANGKFTLLNRSWRNPQDVLEWGEACLGKLPAYRSRNPISEGSEGSVGLLEWWDLVPRLEELAEIDTLIVARNNWNLERVTRALYERGIPWRSISEERSSRWESPAKIGLVATVRALLAGEQISEQDFRRLTETWPAKAGEIELFTRGTKARWKKLECTQELQKTLDQLTDWGAGDGLADWIRSGGWRTDMFLQIDVAAERWGMDVVRNPRIRVGTVHSVKGMEARVVLCLASSTAAAAASGLEEEMCLQYVAVTRASGHYRLVVDQTEVSRGLPVFWAAPEGFAEFDRRMDFLESERGRVGYTGEDPFAAGELGRGGLQTAGESLYHERGTGSGGVLQGQVPGNRSEKAGRGRQEDPAAQTEGDQEEWWNL